MLNVLCVRVGNKYSPDYVYKLKEMVARNLKEEHRFICLTEHPHHVKGVETIAAPLQIADSWCKIGLFAPVLRLERGERCLYLDLDVVITGNLDGMLKGKLAPSKNREGIEKLNTDLWISKDWRDPFNSSVMYWVHGTQTKIYAAFRKKDMERLRGDQNLIAEVVPDAKTFKEGDILSYKFSGVHEKDEKPKNAKIVLFHGKPKMEDLPHIQWIQKEWK